MPIETGTTIAELDETWPLSNDNLIEGDNHLRLIKAVLKDQFPGELGDGLAAVVAATEAEFSYLVGVTSSIQEQLDAIVLADAERFPIGHHLFTINILNPADYGYPGVWALVAIDASFNSVDSLDPFLGSVTGVDVQAVPMLQHNHTTPNHTHTGSTDTSGQHDHTVRSSGTQVVATQVGLSGASAGSINDWPSMALLGGQHAHSVNITSGGAGSTGSTGVVNPTINVKGAVYNLLCWERTD